MPLLLRSRFFGLRAQSRPMTSVLVAVRRLSILGILLLAYLTHRLVNQAYPLTVIGLLSFVAVAQFGPAFVGGLYWPRRSGPRSGRSFAWAHGSSPGSSQTRCSVSTGSIRSRMQRCGALRPTSSVFWHSRRSDGNRPSSATRPPHSPTASFARWSRSCPRAWWFASTISAR
ncbi:hypothetical protein [Bradyrhizobium diazoefficiens]|uniref:hypothetical protein n=1 Tax=Bradyrhizobium diazoefficiens TaxID=1355477 RepID=UPI0034E3EDA9